MFVNSIVLVTTLNTNMYSFSKRMYIAYLGRFWKNK